MLRARRDPDEVRLELADARAQLKGKLRQLLRAREAQDAVRVARLERETTDIESKICELHEQLS